MTDAPWAEPTPPLRTPRLRLVPLAARDADEMVAVLADPSLYRFIGGEPPTATVLRERFARQVTGRSSDGQAAWHNWIVRMIDADVAIGTVQATVTLDGIAAEVAWVIGVPWQGRGYASEAAGALVAWLRDVGVTDVIAHVRPEHAASAGVAASAGLSPTGIIEDGEQRWRLAPPPAATESDEPVLG